MESHGSGFTIHPDELEETGKHFEDFGDRVTRGGEELDSISRGLSSKVKRDKSGIGGLLGNVLDEFGERGGNVFRQGGRVGRESGSVLRKNSQDYLDTDHHTAGNMRSMDSSERSPSISVLNLAGNNHGDSNSRPWTPTEPSHESTADEKWEGESFLQVTSNSHPGVTKNSNIHFIRPGDVRATPLYGHSGQLDGHSHLSKPDENHVATAWVNREKRTADRMYLANTRGSVRADIRGSEEWTPWKVNETPYYMFSHGERSSFSGAVETVDLTDKVRRKSGPPMDVNLTGSQYGKIVEANSYYQKASGNDPTRPLVLMSCSTGNPLGAGAREFSDYMHSDIHRHNHPGPDPMPRHDVYSATGTIHTIVHKDHAGMAVEKSNLFGQPIPGKFEKWPAPADDDQGGNL